MKMKTLQNSLISLNERMNVRKKERFPKPWDVFRKVRQDERIREGVGGLFNRNDLRENGGQQAGSDF